MSDIDFDELDRAVSNLMNQRSGAQKTATSEATAPAASAEVPASAEPAAASAAPSPAPAATAAPAATVTRRPVGRFMDVVHPSSDMQRGVHREAPSVQPSREAKPMMPTSTSSPAASASPSPAPAAATLPAAPIEPGEPTLPAEPVNALPASEPPAVPVVDDIVLEDIQPDPVSAPEPMQSPFLNNVSVDKRPLGAMMMPDEPQQTDETAEATGDIFAPASTEPADDAKMMDAATRRTTLEPLTAIEPTEHTEATLPGTEADPRQDLNQPDLDVVLADAEVALPTDLAAEGQPAPPELDAEVMALESDDAASRQTSPAAPRPTPSEPTPTPGDIPRQYAASTPDAPQPHDVFEAAVEAPAPLQHAEKKKSGISIVLWILLMILIGAGGGVAAWYFLLQ